MRPAKILIHFAKTRTKEGTVWTIHTRGQCLPVRKLRIRGVVETEWHPDKKDNPRAFFICYGRVRCLSGVAVVHAIPR